MKESMKFRTISLSPCFSRRSACMPRRPMAQADLAQKKNCMACHAVDKKLVGPSYKDVAAKYAGQKDAVDKLAAKVVKGARAPGARCRCRPTRRSPMPKPSSSSSGS
jgi:cytochrome c551/c552